MIYLVKYYFIEYLEKVVGFFSEHVVITTYSLNAEIDIPARENIHDYPY